MYRSLVFSKKTASNEPSNIGGTFGSTVVLVVPKSSGCVGSGSGGFGTGPGTGSGPGPGPGPGPGVEL